MIEITTRAEYDYCVSRGFQPLIDWRRFKLDFFLRVDIQHEYFGSGNFQQENQKFYKWVYDHSIKRCAETGQPIHENDGINRRNIFSAKNVSHIITKGSDRRMAIDPRNANLLIIDIHNIWDFGTEQQKRSLNIYPMNQLIIQMLKDDYNLK
jgi:hypothetical protein